MGSLAQLAASLSALPQVAVLHRAAAAACLQLRDLHGRSRWSSAAAAAHVGVRTMAAMPQQLSEDDIDAVTSPEVAQHLNLSAEGDVVYPEGRLLNNIQHHWQLLQQCQSSQAYTQTISFDEFGHRYIQQLEQEEAARSRALAQLKKDLEADAKAGRSFTRGGGLANRLVSVWLPLLQQAIEEEQRQVVDAAARSSNRRDRPNYGPYLLLLSPEDLAHITLQTVLSRIATALPDADDLDVTSSSSSSSTTWHSGSSFIPSSASTSYSGSGSPSAGDAVMSPALLLSDAIGRAVNSRVKYLRFKHHQQEYDHKERAVQQQARKAYKLLQQADAGGKLSESLNRYNKHSHKEAAEFQAGQKRLDLFQQVKSLRAAEKKAAKAAKSEVHWDQEVCIKVGAALLALLVENSHLSEGLFKPKVWRPRGTTISKEPAQLPAFEYVYVKQGLKQQSFVRASQALVGVLLADRTLAAQLLTKVPPMLVPPLPWTRYNTGGYLTSRHYMMRTRWSRALVERLRACDDSGDYQQVLDALNVLGNTSWKINRRVYGVMTSLWETRSTGGDLPQQIPIKPPPPPSTQYRLIYENGGLSMRSGTWSKRERRQYVLECDDVRRLNRNMASLKSDFLLKLKVAADYCDAPEFYYPHTLDFRGRAYPLHPSLHHLGDDICRGLLMFAQGQPLGPQGLDWLYVHMANVWGHGQDKLSFDGRRAFARSNLATILSVAADPVKEPWWQEAEKPWQALAACFEISAALQSMEPATYVSNLPVHMDGSCNGLQHYAALGRDEAGGKAVNLLPSDKPQDVYKGVAEIVARRAAADAAAGDINAQRCVSLIDRKIVKQTVMTSVYGVTAVGARAQIENRLKEKRTDMKHKASLLLQQARDGNNGAAAGPEQSWLLAGIQGLDSGSELGVKAPGMQDEFAWMDDRDTVWLVSKYLADNTLNAISQMFSSAREIMNWLAECARLVASDGDGGSPVCWTSPLGLPIMQPYHKPQMVTLQTATQTFTVQSPEATSGQGSRPQWQKAKQRSAFPPNFIHSVDSTHMMMTALACSELGIPFAGVHDSFWTLAGHVPSMNKLLRQKFVELHTRQPDLLEVLLEELQQQHPNIAFPPIPALGKLQIGKVRQSRYFFS